MQTSSTELKGVTLNQAVYLVGDIHGRLDLLEHLLELVDSDIILKGYKQPLLVFVGDYIDRGEQSAEVLTRVHDLSVSLPQNVICLMGNHEAMLLNFLEDPIKHGRRWLRNGGLQTLASFQIFFESFGELPISSDLVSGAAKLRERLGFRVEWLRNLSSAWNQGNLWAVHAGADPSVPMSEQSFQTCIWGHPEFMKVQRRDGVWVVHGHSTVDAPLVRRGIISIDTGAYYSNCLTAAAVAPDGSISFLATG